MSSNARPPITPGEQPTDVRVIHLHLDALGAQLPKAEVRAGRLGKGTRAAIAAMQESLGLAATGVLDADSMRRLEDEALARSVEYLIRGTVSNLAGAPQSRLVVRAVEEDREEVTLGQAVTDPRGEYEIRYLPENSQHGRMRHPGITVSVFGTDGALLGSTTIRSVPAFVTVDLSVAVMPGPQPGPPPAMEPVPSVARQVVGRVLNAQDGLPAAGLTVRGTDLDAKPNPLPMGYDVTTPAGLFSLVYHDTAATPTAAGTGALTRQMRLEVLLADGTEIKVLDVKAAAGSIDDLAVSVPPPQRPPSPALDTVAKLSGVDVPANLLQFLIDRGVHTLDDLRSAGGMGNLGQLPVPAESPAVRMLDAQMRLSMLSEDAQVTSQLYKAGFTGVNEIVNARRSAFVSGVGPGVGTFASAQMHAVAHAQQCVMSNLTTKLRADIANGMVSQIPWEDWGRAFPLPCGCPDCDAATSPLAYLADLLEYTVKHVTNNGGAIDLAFLVGEFRQPFDRLPASCDQMEEKVHQVRIAIEVLRAWLAANPPAAPAAAVLAAASAGYRVAAYTTLLTSIGTSYEEIRLARTALPDRRLALAERIGVDLGLARPDALDAMFLDPSAPQAAPNAISEVNLEALFGLVDTTRDPLAAGPVPQLQSWQAAHLRTEWLAEDFPPDLPTGGRPVIDPDIIGPDDFRVPVAKANVADPDQPFDIWLRRRAWVDARLTTLEGITVVVNGQPVPDLPNLLAAMYNPVTYETTTLTPWAATTSVADFDALNDSLSQGIDVANTVERLLSDLALEVDAFQRLEAVRTKSAQAALDPRNPPVQPDEWREVWSILVEAMKDRLHPAWLLEEQTDSVLLGPIAFWPPLAEPVEGDWPPVLAPGHPLIDPDELKVTDLPEPVAGQRALAFWTARVGEVAQIAHDLRQERETNGFSALLRHALGDPNIGDPLPVDIDALQANLLANINLDATRAAIKDQLFMTVDDFQRMMLIRAKDADPDPLRKPTLDDYAAVYGILTAAQKRKRSYPTWVTQEQNAATGVVYYTARKAVLPRWRASADVRLEWRNDLAIRSEQPNIDPDVIGPGDIRSPQVGNAAYDVWAARRAFVDGRLAARKATREGAANPFAGIDAIILDAVGASGPALAELVTQNQSGTDTSGRLMQLSLDNDAFATLMRVRDLAAAGAPVLESEWGEVYSILVEVEKRRLSAAWRDQERTATAILGPDLFAVPVVDTSVFPPPLPPPLPAWLATVSQRSQFEDTLQSRIDQDAAVVSALKQSVSNAEEVVLPPLRDALAVAAFGGSVDSAGKAGTSRLVIDCKAGGCQITTRVAQAIETIQNLLFSLRTDQIQQAIPTLALDADHFDEEWDWLGSYATWRAAIFVFVYPEDILIPSLLPQQTPALQTLIGNLRDNQRLTPEAAYDEAATYSDYFRDVSSLILDASAVANTRIHTGSRRDRSATSYSPLLYVFARGGSTGAVLWSSYDTAQPEDHAQTYWDFVPGMGSGVIEVEGCTSYQVAPGSRFLYVFARILDKGTQKLVFTRYDLEKQAWDDAPKPLDLPKPKGTDNTAGFTAVVKQHDDEADAPHLAIRLAGGGIYERHLNRDGSDWQDGDWTPAVPQARGQAFASLDGMVAIAPDEYYLFATQPSGTSFYRLLGPRDDGSWQLCGSIWTALFRFGFRGAFSWPGTDQVEVFVGVDAAVNAQTLQRSSNAIGTTDIGDIPTLDSWLKQTAGVSLAGIVITDGSKFDGMTLLQFYTLDLDAQQPASDWVTWVQQLIADIDYRQKGKVYADAVAGQLDKDGWLDWKLADGMVQQFTTPTTALNSAILTTFGWPTPGDAGTVTFLARDTSGELTDPVGTVNGMSRVVPTSGPSPAGSDRLVATQRGWGQVGVYRSGFSHGGDGGASESGTVRLAPYVTGPFDITERLSRTKLQFRRALIQWAFNANAGQPASNLAYLEEAYYFVPVHLALQLQAKGHYTAALDWFRSVYDYSEPLSERKIYYGLTLEESLGPGLQRSPDWLLDPLNPHAIARTRANTYTRFTLIAEVRCLLDYADQEFSRDTAESVPLARTLYLTALDLLDTPDLQQALDPCNTVIGNLNIDVGDPQWVPVWQRLVNKMVQIGDYAVVQRLGTEVAAIMNNPGPLVERLAQADAAVSQRLVASPRPPTFAEVIARKETDQALAHAFLMIRPEVVDALRLTSAAVARDVLHSVAMVVAQPESQVAGGQVEVPWLAQPISALKTIDQASLAAGASAVKNLARLASGNGALAAGGLRGPGAMPTLRNQAIAPTHQDLLATLGHNNPMNAISIVGRYGGVGHWVPAPSFTFCVPPNPILKALRLHAELNLYKLRTCRNIAGDERQLDPYAAPTDTSSGLPTIGPGGQLTLPGAVTFHPTPYRYSVLIERARQLTQVAGQMEAAMLSALEKRDAEFYNLLKARQDMRVAQAGVRLQDLQCKQAQDNVKLAELQRDRAQIQADHYKQLLDEGLSQLELASLQLQSTASMFFATAAAMAAIPNIIAGMADGVIVDWAGTMSNIGQALSTQASMLTTMASYERRAQEWDFQRTVALQDVRIGAQQVNIAQDGVRVAGQQLVIAQMQADNAQTIVDFLANKFTNSDLYDWMSRILQEVYSFFLQRATATAQLAAAELAFERQQVPPPFIQADYWEAPVADGQLVNPSNPGVDRRGLTGSARLLQDITQLDDYAFQTNQRKLQISKSFSLARMAPAEFQRFRETGVLPFDTRMVDFDRDFQGHYLRLIRRVRTSVLALVPPAIGIHATLTAAGTSRIVIGGDTFQTVVQQRAPQTVALSSPKDATGLFELDPQSDMLLPFEDLGVDMHWEFRMPRAANLFDFSTIADVLVTIDYTALDSFDYRQQVIQSLPQTLSADRPFSFRQHFADTWYDLHNPDQTATPLIVQFTTSRTDYPPNLDDLHVQHVVMYFVRAAGQNFEVPVSHLYFNDGTGGRVGGSATSVDGVISTRRGNAGSWMSMIGKAPSGSWELALPDTSQMRTLLTSGILQDILLIVTYSGKLPAWPQ